MFSFSHQRFLLYIFILFMGDPRMDDATLEKELQELAGKKNARHP